MYPVHFEADYQPEQNRATTFFRLILAIPAAIIAGVLRYLGLAVAVIGWFASLVLGDRKSVV